MAVVPACTSPTTCARSIRRARAGRGSGTPRTSAPGEAPTGRAVVHGLGRRGRAAVRGQAVAAAPSPPADARFAGARRGARPHGRLGARGGRRGAPPAPPPARVDVPRPAARARSSRARGPDAVFTGWIEAGDRRTEVAGWRGMVGHNWGSEHAERWVWLHAVGLRRGARRVARRRARPRPRRTCGHAVDRQRRARAGRRAAAARRHRPRARHAVDAQPGALEAVIAGRA